MAYLEYDRINELLELLYQQKQVLTDLFFVWFVIISFVILRYIYIYKKEHNGTAGIIHSKPAYFVFWFGCIVCLLLIDLGVYRGEYGGIVYEEIINECYQVGGEIDHSGYCVPKNQ